MSRIEELFYYLFAYKNAKNLIWYYHYQNIFEELLNEYKNIEGKH